MRLLLQRHAALRRAFVVAEQVACAALIYTGAGLIWRALGDGSSHPGVLTVLAATAVVAAVLSVSRRRFERVANWLAFGEDADGYELASAFLTRMATTLEVDEVLPRLAETAARSVGSRRGEVRVWLADGNTWRQTWPNDAVQGASDVTVPVQHGGDPVGQMVVSVDASDLSPADRRLLDQLAGPAGLALSTVRLTHALRQQAEEIEATSAQIRASRQRIVEARRTQQDGMRHQLATTVQPHLDAACDELAPPLPVSEAGVRAAADEVRHALDELRSLTRGLFPAGLADAGLLSALRSWAEQRGRPLAVSNGGEPDLSTLSPDLAATLYFCAVTVLTGAEGDPTVTVKGDGAGVTMEVSAERFDTTSVAAVADRVEAFDGKLTVAVAPESLARIQLPTSAVAVS
jgi:signal transduction histidine kinase